MVIRSFVLSFLLTLFSISGIAKPFWTEKSSYVQGDQVFFIGVVTGAESKESGRKQALENARHELFEFLGVSDFAGVPFFTQMTYEEASKVSSQGWDVYRLMYVNIDELKKVKKQVWKKKGNYSDEDIKTALRKIKKSNGKDELAALELHMKLQPRHKELVIKNLNQSYPGWNPILIDALKSVITSRDRSLVLQHLAKKVSLVTFVLFYNWEKKAKETLITHMSTSTGYVSGEWLQAVINLRDKDTYPALKNYFVHGWNRHSTYGMIRQLPGMDLSKELPLAWEQAYIKNSQLELDYLTAEVVATGYLPALEYTIQQLGNLPKRRYLAFNPDMLLRRYLDFQGSPKEIKNWWEKNKNKVTYNSNRRKFTVQTLEK